MNKKLLNSYNKFIPVLLVLATLFMGIGYAAINAISLSIDGDVLAFKHDGIVITKINYVDDINASVSDCEEKAFNTTLDSKIVLSDTDPNSSITYEISVYNGYDLDFSFEDVVYDSSFYDNEDIVFEIDIVKGDVVTSKDEITF